MPSSSTYATYATSDRDKIELASLSNAPTLLDFVNSTPAPVVKVLVDFYDAIAVLRSLAFALSWKGNTERSFLLLFTWWALCLYGSVFLRYALVPLVIMAPILIPHIPKRFKPQPQAVFITTEEKLAASLSNLEAIHALRPDFSIHDVLPSQIKLQERLRLLGWLLPPYIALTYWVPIHILVALTGTILLTYRAPWAIATRRVLSHSAYLRAAWRYILSWLSGNYSLPISVSRVSSKSPRATPQEKEKSHREGNTTIRKHAFMFTVLENQRWWVGIDWTAALLPSERPSWCAPIPVDHGGPGATSGSPTTQQAQYQYVPLPPPTTFPLPASTSVVLPAPSGSGFVRKTAKWSWEDNSEWEVLVHREGDKGVKKVRLPPSKVPQPEEETKGSTFTKAAARLSINLSPTAAAPKPRELSPPTSESGTAVEHSMNENEYTDQDGWIYGDNKWENQNAKGGMGKFTRFRRWCRVAILTEEEELVGEEEVKSRFVQLEPKQPVKPPSPDRKQDGPSESKEPVARTDTKPDFKGSPERGRARTIDSAKSDGHGPTESLQQRLKAAFKSNNPP